MLYGFFSVRFTTNGWEFGYQPGVNVRAMATRAQVRQVKSRTEQTDTFTPFVTIDVFVTCYNEPPVSKKLQRAAL